MFKETFIMLLLCLIFIFIMQKNKEKVMVKSSIYYMLLIVFICGNMAYNLLEIFPAFYYNVADDSAPGGYEYKKFGDIDKNLFAYSEGHIFPEEILFPILNNRTVVINQADQNVMEYEKFFQMFAKEVRSSENGIEQPPKNFDFSAEFGIPSRMDYAMEMGNPVSSDLQNGTFPNVYIALEQISGKETIYAFADLDYNLYIY